MLGQKTFSVSELAALIAGPGHEAHGGKERCAIQLRIPSTDSAAEYQRRRQRNSAPHVAVDKIPFVASASAEHPAEKDRDQRTRRGRTEPAHSKTATSRRRAMGR